MVRQHLDERVSSLSGYYIKEKRGCSHLPVPPIAAYHSLAERTNRETTTLEYTEIRKVCVEDTRPSQHTTESIYYTPWSYPCNVLVQYSIVVVSKYKNKASVTPFHNVVHRPRSSSLLKEYHSQWGNSFCKSTKKKQL